MHILSVFWEVISIGPLDLLFISWVPDCFCIMKLEIRIEYDLWCCKS